jgi:hydrogenase expression/formation protein HypD
MKYVDEYRDKKQCLRLASLINAQVKKNNYKIMEVCGTHTAAIHNFGLKNLLSKRIELISGPGCPVCVTSDGYLRNVLNLLKRKDILLATYQDMVKVPVDHTSLEQEKSRGADVRSVQSALEALDLARNNLKREVVFLGVGFETTAPGTAIAIKIAQKERIENFSVYSAHKVIPEALLALCADKTLEIEGFLLPGHVSVVIGVKGYRPVAKQVKIPCVIAGFQPLDILLSIYRLIEAINSKKPILENEYQRIVSENGNPRAKALLQEVFQKQDSLWRGLGVIPQSGLGIRKSFEKFDAFKKFKLKNEMISKVSGSSCLCADVLKGKLTPSACPLFVKKCNPLSPQGPCMVSREGTCRTYFEYRQN